MLKLEDPKRWSVESDSVSAMLIGGSLPVLLLRRAGADDWQVRVEGSDADLLALLVRLLKQAQRKARD